MRFIVRGAEGELSLPVPNFGECPGGGALVSGTGPIAAPGGKVEAGGTIRASIFTLNWLLTVRTPSLAYTLAIDYVLQFPGSPPCPAAGTITGTLAKQ